MKIIMVTMNKNGGLLHYTSQLSNALSSENEVIVIAPLGVDKKPFNNRVRLLTPPLGNNMKNFLCNIIIISRSLKFFNIIIKEKPDVIHFQSSHLWMSFISLILKKKGYVIVTTIHDVRIHSGVRQIDENIAKNLQIRFSDSIIVHGRKAKEEILKKIEKTGTESKVHIMTESKVHIIPHGDYAFFSNFAKEDIEETNSVLFFGNILDYKGLEYLIKAEPLISKEIPDIKIIIAGNGKFNKYRKIIKDMKRFEIFNEFIPNEDVPSFFQRAKIVVLPYIEGTQTGIIPIAYAFKKPVIVTDVGSIPEVVENGKTGFIVPSRDSNALAEAIIKLLKDDKLRKEMGENAYRKMKDELSWDKIAEKTLELYKSVLYLKRAKKLNDKDT